MRVFGHIRPRHPLARCDGQRADGRRVAARVGVGARRLRRLFRRHLGATLSQMARTARVQRAKTLLDTTDLPMSQIALAAGFGSQRRFLAVFSEVYRRPPTEMRRRRVPQEAAVAPLPRAMPCQPPTDATSDLRRRIMRAAAQ
jgi:AraC family transcriptional regulator of adaptative response / DNA-3-methyladenine glycosylase II